MKNWILRLLQTLVNLFSKKPTLQDSGIDDELGTPLPPSSKLLNQIAPPVPAAVNLQVADPHQFLVEEAGKWVGVKESGGENKGKEVEMFQRSAGGTPMGQAWCAAFVCYCLEQVVKRLKTLQIDWDLRVYETHHVLTLWNKTPKDMRSSVPKPGFLILWNFVGTTSGHMGVVTQVDGQRVHTVEGNTSAQVAIIREGDGVYERIRADSGTPKMKVLGFIDPFKKAV